MAKGKYQEWLTHEGLLKIEDWARSGLTDEQIAHNMGIGVRTLYKWKNQFSEITDSLKMGKEVVDIEVENALLKRALGYRFTEVTKKPIVNQETGKTELMIVRTVETEKVPDTLAIIFWLKNRKPEQWRDKTDAEVRSNNPFQGLSTEELRKRIEELRKHIEEFEE